MNARGWVKEGFKTARANFKLIMLFWIVQLPQIIFSVFPQLVKSSPSFSAQFGLIAAFVILMIGVIAVNWILSIGLIHYFKLKHEGQEADIKALWKGGLFFFWRFLKLIILQIGLVALILLAGALPYLLLIISRAVPLLIASIVLSVAIWGVGFYFLSLGAIYAGIIIVAESPKAWEAVKRSYAFTRPRIWILTRLFLLFILIFIPVFLLMAVIVVASHAFFGMDEKGGQRLAEFILSFPSAWIGIASSAALVHFYLTESKPKEEIPAVAAT